MTDPKDRKNNRITSNAPDITDQDEIDENDEDIQDRLEDELIEIDEEMRRERYNFDKDDTDITSNAPNITDTPPRKRDERQ